jgi:Kinesin motor domain
MVAETVIAQRRTSTAPSAAAAKAVVDRSLSDAADPRRRGRATLSPTAPRSRAASSSHGSGQSASAARNNGPSLSWKTQIEALRADTTAEHDLFGGTEPSTTTLSSSAEDRIRVAVRKRPMSTSERTTDIDVVHPLEYASYGRILVYQPRTRVDLAKEVDVMPFAFDNVYDETSSNADIYQQTVRPLIPALLDDGQWASVFAYGQTGSGVRCCCNRHCGAGTGTRVLCGLGLTLCFVRVSENVYHDG